MTDEELIDELTALYESCSDTATAAALDQVLIRLERQKPRPIETVPNGEHVLVWHPEYGWHEVRLSGMDTAAKITTGWTHWVPMPPRPEDDA